MNNKKPMTTKVVGTGGGYYIPFTKELRGYLGVFGACDGLQLKLLVEEGSHGRFISFWIDKEGK